MCFDGGGEMRTSVLRSVPVVLYTQAGCCGDEVSPPPSGVARVGRGLGVAALYDGGVPRWSQHRGVDEVWKCHGARGRRLSLSCVKLANAATRGGGGGGVGGGPAVAPVASPRERLSQHEGTRSQVSSLSLCKCRRALRKSSSATTETGMEQQGDIECLTAVASQQAPVHRTP